MIRLHHCHQTRSMRTLWLLHELGLDFEVVEHAFDKSLRDPSYLALNPVGRVPALEFHGQHLIETGAIAELLCETYRHAGLGRLPGTDERAEWLIWMHFAETISTHGQILTQQHVMLYEDWMRSPVVMKLEVARLGKCYGAIEALLSDGRAHILRGGFSAADIALGQTLYMTRHFAPLDPFAASVAWYDRITARPAFQKCLPPDGAPRLYAKPFYPLPEAPPPAQPQPQRKADD